MSWQLWGKIGKIYLRVLLESSGSPAKRLFRALAVRLARHRALLALPRLSTEVAKSVHKGKTHTCRSRSMPVVTFLSSVPPLPSSIS